MNANRNHINVNTIYSSEKRELFYYKSGLLDNVYKTRFCLFFITESKLKKKWKYLRDQFATESSKIKPPRSGDAAGETVTPKWPHFKLLLFLKDIVKARPSSGNLTHSTKSSDQIQIEDSLIQTEYAEEIMPSNDETREDWENISNSVIATNDNTEVPVSGKQEDTAATNITSNTKRIFELQPTANEHKYTGKRIKKNSLTDSLLDIERQKLEILAQNAKRRYATQTNDDDEDLLFLKSLLPHIKKIPDNRKLSFRGRIQEIVEQFAYPSPSFCNIPNPYTPHSSYSSHSPLSNPGSCNAHIPEYSQEATESIVGLTSIQ